MAEWDTDPEGPSEADLERFGDEYRKCPECDSLVYDQTDICQACGHAFSKADSGLPIWAIVTVGMVLLLFVLVVVL